MLPERITSKITVEPMYAMTEESCWTWTAALGKQGYGRYRKPEETFQREAHRVVYEIERGPIPDGNVLMHSCDVRLCVNPSHLVPGTRLDNNKDRDRKGRVAHGENHFRSTVTRDQVVGIRASTKSHREVAAEFGVGYSTVINIRAGRTRRRDQ